MNSQLPMDESCFFIVRNKLVIMFLYLVYFNLRKLVSWAKYLWYSLFFLFMDFRSNLVIQGALQLDLDLGLDDVTGIWSSKLSIKIIQRSVVAERSSLPDSSSGVSNRMWVRIPAVTLVSLSKTLNHNCFSPPRG